MIPFLVYACIILASVTQSASAKQYNAGQASPNAFCFNALKALSAFALLGFAALFGFTFHVPTLLYGTLYGLSLCISMYTGYRAICLGQMALTSMVVSFSLILPLVWNFLFRNEKLGSLQGVALGCLAISLVLVNADKLKTRTNCKANRSLWAIFVALTFFTNGICSILQKEHQLAYPGQFNREFVLFAMLVCALIYSVVVMAKTPKGTFRKMRGKRYAVLSGISNATANLLTLALAGFENASILFPIISAGTIFGSLLCGRWLFKEKLHASHYIAIAFGTVAVVLLKL